MNRFAAPVPWPRTGQLHRLFIFVLPLLLMLAALTPTPSAHAEKPKKNILYLNSYHHGYQWSDSILEGVRSVLDESAYKIDLQIEYMDAKKYNTPEVSERLITLYREKFKNEQFDVVIASDNDAFDFAQKYRNTLFPGVPIVFCGVNETNPMDFLGQDIVGVVETFDLPSTIDAALKIHPATKRMIVVGDESTAGRFIRQQIRAVVPQYSDRLKVEYWTQNSLKEVQDKVEQLGDDTILFFIPYYLTVDGRFYTAEEVMAAIYQHSRVPIYTAWEFLLGHGAVGGKLLSGFLHGQTAASMALRIMRGESPDTIPIYREPTGRYLFDYNVLTRLDIDPSLLPEGSGMVNAPKVFYELPKELFWTIIISFILLFVALVFLILAMVQRRRAERKMKDQLAFQETLMDALPQLVSWKDAGGRILGANRSFTEFFNVSEQALLSKLSITELSNDTNYGQWSEKTDALVINGKGPVLKKKRTLSDSHGNSAWIEVNKVPVRDQAGRIVGVLSTADNITKERNLEKQLLQSQKMEAIGTLAGGIAHDFNNILTSIINSTELAAGDVEPDSVTRKDLLRVLKAARRGGRVVKQILAFSRPSTGGFRSTDVGEAAGEALGLLEASLPGNIELRSYISPSLSPVNADPTQLHQVVMNLCTNAFQALRPTGGTIEVRVEDAELDTENAAMFNLAPGAYVRLVVSDNGPGIPPEIVDKIFDPFFSTKDKTEGTGLGLSVVHGIVHSHGGGMRVVSAGENSQGARFEICLPKADAPDTVHLPGDRRHHATGGTILFVEDDEDQLLTTPRLLETLGYTTTAIRNPEEAPALIAAEPDRFDLVISDYDMPGMSGTDLAKHFAAAAPDLPIILVSGREDAVEAASGLHNIKRVVIKPYDKNDLAEAVNAALGDISEEPAWPKS